MRCEVFRERLLDGPDAGHAEVCSSCRSLAREFEEEARLLSTARVPSAPADLWRRIEARLVRAGRFARIRRWGGLAAAAALVVAAVGVLFRKEPPAERPVATLKLHVVEVPEETARAFSGIVPSYGTAADREVMVSAVAPHRPGGGP